MKLIIYAANIHRGGGATLLKALLTALSGELRCVVFIDERMVLDTALPAWLTVIPVAPKLTSRLYGEYKLKQYVLPEDVVLCFGNLPPLFNLKAHPWVFLHNRYLIEPFPITGFPTYARLRIILERLWLNARKKHTRFIVQTPSMAKALLENLNQQSEIIPFLTYVDFTRKSAIGSIDSQRKYDFLFVASGEPHKNHRCLIEAWCLLAGQGLFPSLCLTLDQSASKKLCDWIDKKQKEYGLSIHNVGALTQFAIKRLYKEAGALIYPSSFESLGIPLIEAREANLPILAAELDYVRDVIDPEETFNPASPVSIARAVKRFLKIPEAPLSLVSPAVFIRRLIADKR